MRKRKLAYSSTRDNAISQNGTPKGRRLIIAIGEVKGNIEIQNAIVEPGFCITDIDAMMPIITGMVAIVDSCEASCTLSTAEPMAAYIAE